MVRGSEVLRSVLPLRVGLEDIAVCTDVAFLVTMDITILMSGCLWGRARGRDMTPFFC